MTGAGLATVPLLQPELQSAASIVLSLVALGALAAILVLLLRNERRREGELETLAALARAVSMAPDDAAEVAEAAYVHAARMLPTDFFQLGLFQGAAYRTLIWVRDGDRIHNREFVLDSEHAGLVGWVRKTGEPLLVGDFRAEADRLPARPSYDSPDPPLSGLFVPLAVEGSVIGVIAVQSRIRRAFRSRELHLLRALAATIASSLASITWRDRARERERQIALLEDISRLLSPLRPLDEVLPLVADAIARRLDAATVAVFERAGGAATPRAAGGAHAQDDALSDPVTREWIASTADAGRPLERLREIASGTRLWEYAAPLRVQEKILGVLYVGRRNVPFLPSDHRLIDLVASQLALAQLEASNFAQQQEEAWFTTVLLEVARHAAEPGDVASALNAVLELTTLLAGAEWAIQLTFDPARQLLTPTAASGLPREQVEAIASIGFRVDEFGLGDDLTDETPRRLPLPDRFGDIVGETSALACVLTDGSWLLGLMLVQGKGIQDRRLSLIAGIAHQVSLRLENARLSEDAAVRRSLDRELETARTIQESFLPERPPELDGWEISAYWKAARSVGGDFYDFIRLADGPNGERWGLAIADVTDKGVPAALYMALTRTLLRSIAYYEASPAAALGHLNRLLINDTRGDMFVTMAYLIWEPGIGRATYANAGHCLPLLFQPEREALVLANHQALLGVLSDVVYEDTTIRMPRGSLLVLYTDGVSEAAGPEGSLFGPERIQRAVEGQSDWSPAAAIRAIGEAVGAFGSGAEPTDDQTIVCVHRRN
jgi:serine phosphatase RsbU (regulator of sigma subunit)/GAF domain-containing protein